MLRERYGKNGLGLNVTPKSRKRGQQDRPFPNERNLALVVLTVSLTVIFVKVFYEHYDTVQAAIVERKLISYEVISENGQVMFTNTWKSAVKYSGLWLPLICGFLATYFTWMCVYLDSNVPGVNPPSPFSPQKYRAQSGHTFHLNYVFAVLVGLLVTSYMYFKGVSIQY